MAELRMLLHASVTVTDDEPAANFELELLSERAALADDESAALPEALSPGPATIVQQPPEKKSVYRAVGWQSEGRCTMG